MMKWVRVAASIVSLLVSILPTSRVAAAPAPSSPVDWGDSQDNWTSLRLTADDTPYVGYSRMEVGGPLFEVREKHWNGTDWQQNPVDTLLLQQPYPELRLTTGPLRVHYLYNRFGPNGNTIQYRSYDPLNFNGNFIVNEAVFGPVQTQHPVSMEIRSDGQPAVTYWDDATNRTLYTFRSGPNTWAAVPLNLECSDGFPTIQLSTAAPLDRIRVSCLNQNQSQVKYTWEDNNGVLQSNTVFPRPGDPANHRFSGPTLVLEGGLPRIVAFNETMGVLWYAEKAGSDVNDPWTYKIVDNDPARVPAGFTVASSIVIRGGSPRLQVAYTSRSVRKVWYRHSSSLWGAEAFIVAPYLVDGDCGLSAPSLSLSASADGAIVQLSYAMLHLDDQSDSGVKHATWKLPLTQPTNVQLLATHNMTSMALDANGRPVKCFYKDDGAGDVYVEWLNNGLYQVDLVAANVGLPQNFNRGCDVDVAPNGTMGVVYANNNINKPEYRERAPGAGVWGLPRAIWNPADPAGGNGSPHLTLRFNANGEPAVAYSPTIGGVRRLRFAAWNGAAWVPSVPNAAANIGLYVTLAFDGQNRLQPRVGYFDSVNHVVLFSRQVNGVWQAPEQASLPNMGYDIALSTRWLGGVERIWMSYYDYTAQDMKVAERGGAWIVHTVFAQGNVGETTSVGIDAYGKPVFTFLDRTQGRLVTGRWNRYGGLRVDPAPPPGAYRICRVDSGGEGTSLRLDAYDNVRATHKESNGTANTYRLRYFPSP